jgi:hypothetical protein
MTRFGSETDPAPEMLRQATGEAPGASFSATANLHGACPDEYGPTCNNLAPIAPSWQVSAVFSRCPLAGNCSSQDTPLSFLFYITFFPPLVSFFASYTRYPPWKAEVQPRPPARFVFCSATSENPTFPILPRRRHRPRGIPNTSHTIEEEVRWHLIPSSQFHPQHGGRWPVTL